DVQRAVRVGRDELHRHRLAAAGRGAAVVLALFEDAPQRAQAAGGRQGEVDEAGAGDLDLLHLLGGRQGGDDQFGQLARLHAGRLGPWEGAVGGVVAGGGRRGALGRGGRGGRVLGQLAQPARVPQGLLDQFANVLFRGVRFRKGEPRIL